MKPLFYLRYTDLAFVERWSKDKDLPLDMDYADDKLRHAIINPREYLDPHRALEEFRESKHPVYFLITDENENTVYSGYYNPPETLK